MAGRINRPPATDVISSGRSTNSNIATRFALRMENVLERLDFIVVWNATGGADGDDDSTLAEFWGLLCFCVIVLSVNLAAFVLLRHHCSRLCQQLFHATVIVMCFAVLAVTAVANAGVEKEQELLKHMLTTVEIFIPVIIFLNSVLMCSSKTRGLDADDEAPGLSAADLEALQRVPSYNSVVNMTTPPPTYKDALNQLQSGKQERY